MRYVLEEQASFVVCGEAVNGQDAIEKTAQLHPDVVILDLTMPVLNGFAAMRKIKESSPDIPILVLSMHSGRTFVDEAAKLGAAGFLSKTDVDRLVEAVETVCNDELFFPPENEA